MAITTMPSHTSDVGDRFERRIRPYWGTLMTLGIVTSVLGLVALYLAYATTLVSVMTLGILVFAAGLSQVYFAFTGGRWSEFFLHAMMSVLYIAAGLMMMARPIEGAAALTLFLSLFWIVSGAFRIIAGASSHIDGRGWFITSGILTLLLGVLILTSWPVSSLSIIGIVVGVDMLFLGIALISYSAAVRRTVHAVTGRLA